MGMDGLSMSNTGIRREATSLDHSKESEETAKQDTEKSMIVQELTEQERVNEEREENKKRRKAAEKKEADEDSEDDSFEEEDSDDEVEDEDDSDEDPENLLLVDGENHGFYTKLSKNLENIELYDRITDRLIGTISPEELSALISKLNMGTGIFINKKV